MKPAPLWMAIPNFCGMIRKVYASRRLFMIRAFFDDSSDSNKTILIMAGWIGSAKSWDIFSADWHKELRQEKEIDYFSHHESIRLDGEFKDFTVKERDRKIKRLIRVISKHRREIYGLFGGIDLIQYNSSFNQSRVPSKVLRREMGNIHPYQCCVHGSIGRVLTKEMLRGNRSDKVDFIFDEQTKLVAECIVEFKEYFKRRLPAEKQAITGNMSEADDKDVMPLQAADLLAGSAFIAMRDRRIKPFRDSMSQCNLDFIAFDYMPPGADLIYPSLVEDVNQNLRKKYK